MCHVKGGPLLVPLRTRGKIVGSLPCKYNVPGGGVFRLLDVISLSHFVQTANASRSAKRRSRTSSYELYGLL
jgi:hypothetical protein